MKTEKLDYYLRPGLIAQEPAEVRSESRLLVYERGTGVLTDSRFGRIGEYLRQGDCLVLNDTKVLAARFFGRRASGGRLEGLFLFERQGGLWEVMLKGAGKVKVGERIWLLDGQRGDFCGAEVLSKPGGGRCVLRLEHEGSSREVLERIGFAPLPPYIKRSDDAEQAVKDKERYQTVFACELGAVAAPTAGLHFTGDLIAGLKERGVCFAFVTLHVGAGTFKPVKSAKLEDHEMEAERFRIDAANAELINRTKRDGGRIVAVGTTVVRTLEWVAQDGEIRAGEGATELFVQPGYEFRVVDTMVTNFHLPKSTLLALVGAFAGLENILEAYRHAMEEGYRFYSYGDAMLIV